MQYLSFQGAVKAGRVMRCRSTIFICLIRGDRGSGCQKQLRKTVERQTKVRNLEAFQEHDRSQIRSRVKSPAGSGQLSATLL